MLQLATLNQLFRLIRGGSHSLTYLYDMPTTLNLCLSSGTHAVGGWIQKTQEKDFEIHDMSLHSNSVQYAKYPFLILDVTLNPAYSAKYIGSGWYFFAKVYEGGAVKCTQKYFYMSQHTKTTLKNTASAAGFINFESLFGLSPFTSLSTDFTTNIVNFAEFKIVNPFYFHTGATVLTADQMHSLIVELSFGFEPKFNNLKPSAYLWTHLFANDMQLTLFDSTNGRRSLINRANTLEKWSVGVDLKTIGKKLAYFKYNLIERKNPYGTTFTIYSTGETTLDVGKEVNLKFEVADSTNSTNYLSFTLKLKEMNPAATIEMSFHSLNVTGYTFAVTSIAYPPPAAKFAVAVVITVTIPEDTSMPAIVRLAAQVYFPTRKFIADTFMTTLPFIAPQTVDVLVSSDKADATFNLQELKMTKGASLINAFDATDHNKIELGFYITAGVTRSLYWNLFCVKGKYFSESDNLCNNCPTNCISCSGPIECRECGTGFYLDQVNGICNNNAVTASGYFKKDTEPKAYNKCLLPYCKSSVTQAMNVLKLIPAKHILLSLL